MLNGRVKVLRIYLGESETYHGKSLYSSILYTAEEMGLAGATMIKGYGGYGTHCHAHLAHLLRKDEDIPVIVEIVDTQEKIEQFLPKLEEMMNCGLVTMHDVEAVQFTPKQKPQLTHSE